MANIFVIEETRSITTHSFRNNVNDIGVRLEASLRISVRHIQGNLGIQVILNAASKNASFECIEIHIRARTAVCCVRQYGFVTDPVPRFSAEVDPLLAHCTDEIAEMFALIIVIIHRPVFGWEIQAERKKLKEITRGTPSEIYRKEFKLLIFSSLTIKHA